MDGKEKPERKSRVRTFFSGLLECFDPDIFDCVPESIKGIVGGLVALATVVAILCGLAIFLYHLIVDPDAVHVGARLDSLSINPGKLFPRS